MKCKQTIYMRKIIFILFASLTLQSTAQNLFPVKLETCPADRFCLDCGDTKAGYDEKEFLKLQDKLNTELNLRGIKGVVKFQVLVDSKGRACVLSHTDQTNNPISLKIVEELNKFKNWSPAMTEGKKEEKSSINLIFTINENKIVGKVERVDMTAFKKSFNKPQSPEIYNKTYVYNNENLKNYKITVWNTSNSNLPNNTNDQISIDQNGLIWLTIEDGLVTFDGKEFKNAEQNITEKEEFNSYYAIESDNDNVKWVYGIDNIYSFNNVKWTKYDPKEIGINGVYEMVNNPKTNEVFFCSDEGLTILKDGKWSNINKTEVKEFPSNRVTFAKRDSENRIWIGTFSGTVMIDQNGKATNFENTETVLKGKCITSMDEDESGNLYFSLYQFEDNEGGKVNRNEGIAIRYADGTIKQFTTENSGLPFNHTNCVVYDKNEKVLWISTDRAGLVRFDLKNNWENYHSENSDIPTSSISTMEMDKNGNLYLATRQGLVKMERK